jgi:chromosome segregation ATPase
MTGISSIMETLKKNQAVVEELAATTKREISEIQTQIEQLIKRVTLLQDEWDEREATEEELTREAASLEGELSAESQEQGKLESTSSTQQQAIVDAKKEREQLQMELAEIERRLEGLEDDIRTADRGLRNAEKEMGKVDEKLASVDDKISEQLQDIDAQVAEARREAELQEARYKALRYLLKEGIVTMPEAKVAAELKDKDTTTLDHLQKTTFIGRFKVREIIQQMAERKIVRFDKNTEQVKVRKQIDL